MKYFIITLICLSSILFLSCDNKKDQRNSLCQIDIGSNISKLYEINLSDFTDNINYVKLENDQNVLLKPIYDFDINENLVVVSDMNLCLLFNIQGDFISKIGNIGRGPEEYTYITNVKIDKDKRIYLSSLFDLLEFHSNGSFESKYSNIFLIKDKYFISSWCPIDDSSFFGHVPNSDGQKEFKALIIDKNGHLKYSFKNYILFNRDREVANSDEWKAHIYYFNNRLYYKDFFNDTLFYLDDKYKLNPAYSFNIGKYKEPVSERAKVRGNDRLRFIYVYNVFQTKKYLFVECKFGNKFPAKRITPLETPIPTLNPIWYNTRSVLGIFDKIKGNLVFCKPTSTNNRLFTSGLYNDFDAGPRFFPQKQINDSTMAMFIEVKQLKEHIASDDFRKNNPKFPEKKEELEDLVNSLNEFDNPVLMFVTIKTPK